jgi:hypothetical protein
MVSFTPRSLYHQEGTSVATEQEGRRRGLNLVDKTDLLLCSGEVLRPVIKPYSEERDISRTVLKVSDINIVVRLWELE